MGGLDPRTDKKALQGGIDLLVGKRGKGVGWLFLFFPGLGAGKGVGNKWLESLFFLCKVAHRK